MRWKGVHVPPWLARMDHLVVTVDPTFHTVPVGAAARVKGTEGI